MKATSGPTEHQPRAPAQSPVEAVFAADEASRGLGIALLEHGPGTAVLRMTVTAAMVNGHRIAHGGYVFLLADTAFACACNSHGPVTVAAGAGVDFVAPAYERDVLVATARGGANTPEISALNLAPASPVGPAILGGEKIVRSVHRAPESPVPLHCGRSWAGAVSRTVDCPSMIHRCTRDMEKAPT